MKLLVDRNVVEYGKRYRMVTRPKAMKWGPHTVTAELFGFQAKELPQGEWMQAQLHALPTIARLAQEGAIELLSSEELDFESMGSSVGAAGPEANLFRHVSIGHVPSALDRSYFFNTIDLDELVDGTTQEEWCVNFLLPLSVEFVEEILANHRALPEFDRAGLEELPRFRELCKGLTGEQVRDAFHLWTAERNSLSGFLTMDKKFMNVMFHGDRLTFSSPPISPVELLETLGVQDLDPLPLPEDGFIPFHDTFRDDW